MHKLAKGPTRLANTIVADMQDFKSATTGVAAKAMRNELNKMVQGVQDPAQKKVRLTLL
jgi:UTP--glucose-1-phosphate uridylyltransferase